jgi:hypothetical protein
MAKLLDIRKRIGKMKREAAYKAFFEVRDARDAGYFHIDNIFVDIYARVVGPYGTLVYQSLCRHCDKDQICFPSVRLIADEMGISPNTVVLGLKRLVAQNIIQADKRTGQPTIYRLMNKKHWKKTKDVIVFHKYIMKGPANEVK